MDSSIFTSGGGEIDPSRLTQPTDEYQRLVKRCREELAAHIERRTGIAIEPLRVRLRTKQTDSYTWLYTTEVAHLFSKNLSDHNIAAYKMLCQEVGHSFHAVTFPKAANGVKRQSFDLCPLLAIPPAFSSAAEADAMGCNEILTCTTSQLYLTEESLGAERARNDCLHEELESLAADHEDLARKFREQAERAGQTETLMYKCLNAMDQIRILAEGVQEDHRNNTDGSVFIT
ncbi:hypothetical protein FDECE_3472 [Fusarium decemcellulare]|nr:hypothetical protein FDECE_3472 [Fusarium decemcellulare]